MTNAMIMSRRRFIVGASALCCCGQVGGAEASQEQVICALGGSHEGLSDSGWRPAAGEAQQVVQLITEGVGVKPNFVILAADFERSSIAYAGFKDGRRRIVYDAAMLSFGSGRTSWKSVGVLAHEIGHHLATHVFVRDTSSHERELEADHFSGAALFRLGANLDQALSWTEMVSETPSESHPGRAARIEAARAGWQQARTAARGLAGQCKADWIGRVMKVEGRQCRMARVCQGGEEEFRLACQDNGGWSWRK